MGRDHNWVVTELLGCWVARLLSAPTKRTTQVDSGAPSNPATQQPSNQAVTGSPDPRYHVSTHLMENVIAVGLILPKLSQTVAEEHLEELTKLIESAGGSV